MMGCSHRPVSLAEPPTALCLGEVSEELVALVGDVLEEMQIRVCATLPAGRLPSLVLVGVGHQDPKRAIARARRSAGGVPLVAVLPIADRRLAAVTLQSGADACYALGTPLSRLRVAVAQILISRWTHTPCASADPRRSS